MRQGHPVTGYLSNRGSNLFFKSEIVVLKKKSADTTKIKCWEEVLKVQVKHVTSTFVVFGIVRYCTCFPKSVGYGSYLTLFLNFSETCVEQMG